MLITPEDILGMNNSLDDLYKKERVNINCFGSLTIKCSEFVYSASSYIGKITGSWMQSFTYWTIPGLLQEMKSLGVKVVVFHCFMSDNINTRAIKSYTLYV